MRRLHNDDETTDTRPSDHFPSAGAGHSLGWSLPLEPTRGAIMMVILYIRRQQPLQMRLVDGNHMIHQFTTTAANPALDHSVLPRTTHLSPQRPDAKGRIAQETSGPYLES